MNGQEQYIATAYVGRQHKGLGSVLSYDQTKPLILFRKQFQIALQERDYYYHIEGTNAFRLFNVKAMVLEA